MREPRLAVAFLVVIHDAGGGTRADAVLDPEEKEKDYPEPDMFGRMPSYALFARHVAGLDMDHIRAQQPGTAVRAMLAPVHLARIVKASF
jgi:hypothetical protein